MLPPRHLVTLVAVACLLVVALLLHGHALPAAGAKFVASSAFVALAVSSGAAASVYGRLVLAGLVFSWCGDLLLVGASRQAFLAGLAAFLLAHLAYVGAFIRHGVDRGWAVAAALPVGVIAITVWAWLAPYTAADLALPVRIYIVVISLMVILAVATRGCGGSRLIVAGAMLFFASDLSVAALRLVQTTWPTYVIGLPLYYAAQVCFALSVSQSRSH